MQRTIQVYEGSSKYTKEQVPCQYTRHYPCLGTSQSWAIHKGPTQSMRDHPFLWRILSDWGSTCFKDQDQDCLDIESI